MLPIVDIHSHYIAGQPNAIENYRRLAARPDVSRVVVCALNLRLPHSPDFPYMSSTFNTTNDQLEAMIRAVDSPKLLPFCYVDPREKDAPHQVQHWIRKRGMRGVKLYPPLGWYPSDPCCIEVCKAIQDCGVPALFHMGRVASHPGLHSQFSRPIHLEDVWLACPSIKLIVGHFAAPWYLEAIHIAMSFPNWCFDLTTSGSWNHEAIRHLSRIPWDPGLKRIVMGTDGDGSSNVQRVMDNLKVLEPGGFTAEEIDMFVHHNGLALLGEKEENGLS